MVNEINSILDYIEEHIQEEIGLTELSETFHYSESYISRMFNRYVGMSIKEYLNKRRLSRIAVLLRKEHKSVEYLAHTHGYSSQKYLSTLFKKEFQLTPSAYKKTDSFIHITPRRNVKGEENMKIKNTKELCEMIFKKTATQNDLLDLISSMENCELIEQENSDIRLVTYVDEEKYTQIYEVKLNVLSGHYTSQEIFYFKKDDYRITKFYKNDEIRLEFEDINSGKLLDAVLYEGVVTEVMLDSKVLKEFIIDNSQSDITPEEFRDGHLNVERISKELLTLTNDQEVMDYLSNDKELIPLKSFGASYKKVK